MVKFLRPAQFFLAAFACSVAGTSFAGGINVDVHLGGAPGIFYPPSAPVVVAPPPPPPVPPPCRR